MKAINFETIYSDFYSKVLNFIKSKINYKFEIAEELTNDVFMKIHKHLNNFDPKKSQLETWILTIANRIVIDYYRTDKSHLKVNVSNYVDSEDKEIFDFVSLDSNTIEDKETYHKIRREMRKLKPGHKKIALLFFIQNMQINEIAKMLEIPEGTVKGTILRIREKLQRKLVNIYQTV